MRKDETLAANALTTPWTGLCDLDHPLPEYPRPSLVREDWLSLNGPWEVEIAQPGSGQAQVPRLSSSIIVPFPLEASLSGVGARLEPGEVMRYRKSFSLPGEWSGRRILLHFGAVDWEAKVWLNGRLLGGHRGGFLPFSLDLSEALLPGEGVAQSLLVEVSDPTDKGLQCRGKQSSAPGGIWYTSASGMWQSVWLEPLPAVSILRCVAEVEAGRAAADGFLAVTVWLSGPAAPGQRLTVRASLEGRPVGSSTAVLSAADCGQPGAIQVRLTLSLSDPRPWSPASPTLYGLELDLEGQDKATSYAALRTVSLGQDSAGHRRICLNGEVLFHNGVLDQGYWPEGVYTAPTDEALASDIRAALALGFNTIRKHAKVECERWYWHCDRLGALVWQDIPSGGRPMDLLHSAIFGFGGFRLRDDLALQRFGREDPEGRADFEAEAQGIVDHLRFFPSIVAWVPFNEGWGQFESRRIAQALKATDPSRLVDAASGWYDRGGGDMASRHDYLPKPRFPRPWRGGRRDLRVPVLSEFGGLTLKVEGHSTADKRQFGYVGASSGEDLARRYEALAGHLSRLAREGLAASIYTQITDVEIERNGLLTYDRRLLKTELERIRTANEALIAAGGNP